MKIGYYIEKYKIIFVIQKLTQHTYKQIKKHKESSLNQIETNNKTTFQQNTWKEGRNGLTLCGPPSKCPPEVPPFGRVPNKARIRNAAVMRPQFTDRGRSPDGGPRRHFGTLAALVSAPALIPLRTSETVRDVGRGRQFRGRCASRLRLIGRCLCSVGMLCGFWRFGGLFGFWCCVWCVDGVERFWCLFWKIIIIVVIIIVWCEICFFDRNKFFLIFFLIYSFNIYCFNFF